MTHMYRGQWPSFYISKIILVLGTVIFFLALFANAWTLSARALAPGLRADDSMSIQAPTDTIPAVAVASGTAVSSTATPQPESIGCSVPRAYHAPTAIDATTASDGLTLTMATPYTYVVSAKSLEGLRRGIAVCPARVQVAGDYHAITARQLTWSYRIVQAGGQCSLANVRVGLSLAQLLPEFAPQVGTPQSVVDTWNAYRVDLITHENGHVDVAKRYATELVARLNSIGTMDCAALQSQAKSIVESEISVLNAADTDYDAATGHGATQGAVL